MIFCQHKSYSNRCHVSRLLYSDFKLDFRQDPGRQKYVCWREKISLGEICPKIASLAKNNHFPKTRWGTYGVSAQQTSTPGASKLTKRS